MEQQINTQGHEQVVLPPGEDASPDISVTVEYLPAANPFHQPYPETVTIGTVRTDAMAFFGVSDHRDRDTHQFFLEFNRQRLTNMADMLQQLLGLDRKGAHFNLVEQITPGGIL